jgi:hypothetical protein
MKYLYGNGSYMREIKSRTDNEEPFLVLIKHLGNDVLLIGSTGTSTTDLELIIGYLRSELKPEHETKPETCYLPEINEKYQKLLNEKSEIENSYKALSKYVELSTIHDQYMEVVTEKTSELKELQRQIKYFLEKNSIEIVDGYKSSYCERHHILDEFVISPTPGSAYHAWVDIIR